MSKFDPTFQNVVGKVERVCQFCAQRFYTWNCEVQHGWGKFCSRRCKARMSERRILDRFWRRVDKSGDCWLWRGGTSHFGHGLFWLRGRDERAHKVAYLLTYGDVPEGLCVLHRCDVPACVNPAHLFLGTRGDNNRDRTNKGRSAMGERSGHYTHPDQTRRGESHGMSKLTEALVRQIRSEYAPRVVTRKMLTARYGVSRSLIDQIVDHKIWRHV